MMTPIQLIVMLAGLFLSFWVFTFVFFGGTIFSDISESVVIGGAATLGLLTVVQNIWSTILTPMIYSGRWALILPVITGVFAFSRLTRYRWLARYTVAVSSGVGIGVLFGTTIKADIIGNMSSAINNVLSGTPDRFTAWFSVIAMVCVVIYFTFSMKYSRRFHEDPRLKYITIFGRVMLYAAFGYLYSTIMVGEGLGDFMTNMIALVRRPIDAITAGMG